MSDFNFNLVERTVNDSNSNDEPFLRLHMVGSYWVYLPANGENEVQLDNLFNTWFRVGGVTKNQFITVVEGYDDGFSYERHEISENTHQRGILVDAICKKAHPNIIRSLIEAITRNNGNPYFYFFDNDYVSFIHYALNTDRYAEEDIRRFINVTSKLQY